MRSELRDFKAIKDVFGGTVNDVVLTVVSGALRGWLHRRGVRTEGLELRALVPVSIRAENDRGTLGNRIAAMRGPLPVYIEDPVARLQAVRESMGSLKDSKQARRRRGAGGGPELRAADDPRPGLAAELLHAPVQPASSRTSRARSSRSTCAGARCRTSSRSRSCRATTRWRSRSCPTTAG